MLYVQFAEPNKKLLKALISAAKGDRSLADFASAIKAASPEIKVSAPTLSRAMKGDSPVSVELLEAVVKASSDTSVTLEKLVEANGMQKKSEHDELVKLDAAARRRVQYTAVEKSAYLIILNELAKRSYTFRLLGNSSHFLAPLGGESLNCVFCRRFDFAFYLEGVLPCSTWKGEVCYMGQLPKDERAKKVVVDRCFMKCGPVFASDGHESRLYENEKYSFVFVDRELYQLFLGRLNDCGLLVNGWMSAILVDIDRGIVAEETQLKRRDGLEAESIFRTPVHQPEMDEELEDPFDIFEY